MLHIRLPSFNPKVNPIKSVCTISISFNKLFACNLVGKCLNRFVDSVNLKAINQK